MLYDPYYNGDTSKNNREGRIGPLDTLMLHGLANSSVPGALGSCNPLLAMQVLEETTGELSLARLRSGISGLYSRVVGAVRNALDRRAARRLDERLGLDLELSDADYAAMMEEVRRFRWIEAERAGRDIWAEVSAKDPEAAAFKEWFRRHFGAWYLSYRSTKGLAPAR